LQLSILKQAINNILAKIARRYEQDYSANQVWKYVENSQYGRVVY
jgi:hypothetical protein